jgi:hypothetical protein
MDPRANFTGARAIFDEENAIRVYADREMADV